MYRVTAILAIAALTTLGACKKTGEGEFEVKTPDVDVSTDTSTVRTPSVDVGTDTMQEELDASNATRMSRQIAEIDSALERLYREPAKFGVCE